MTSCVRFFLVSLLFVAACDNTAADNSVPLVNLHPGLDVGDPPNEGQFFGFDEPNIEGTWGWSFFVRSPIRVTHVAWYDEGGDGLSHEHRVGLWKDRSNTELWPFVETESAEQLLNPQAPLDLGILGMIRQQPEGIVIPSGTTANLDGPWRKISLPHGPITLARGGYVLGGTDHPESADSIRYVAGNTADSGIDAMNLLPADSRIRIGAPGKTDGYSPVNQFVLSPDAPSSFFLVNGVELGPMLFVEPIPEPHSVILVMVACVVCGAARVRQAEAVGISNRGQFTPAPDTYRTTRGPAGASIRCTRWGPRSRGRT